MDKLSVGDYCVLREDSDRPYIYTTHGALMVVKSINVNGDFISVEVKKRTTAPVYGEDGDGKEWAVERRHFRKATYSDLEKYGVKKKRIMIL